MIYIVSGRGGIKIEGALLPFEEETIYLLKPLTYYEIYSDEPCESKRYHISFSSSDVGENLGELVRSLFIENSACAIIRDFSVDEISRIFAGFDFAEKLPADGRDKYVSAMLMQILILLSSSENKQSYSSPDELAAEIADFISESLDDNRFLTLDEIAKTFFVSKFYLCRVFKGYSGISVHAYINQKRVMKAKQYIDSGMSAKAASKAVGYQDYSAFYRAYVKIVGKSPKSEKGE
jgi:AraC-like DNA-binding protein